MSEISVGHPVEWERFVESDILKLSAFLKIDWVFVYHDNYTNQHSAHGLAGIR